MQQKSPWAHIIRIALHIAQIVLLVLVFRALPSTTIKSAEADFYKLKNDLLGYFDPTVTGGGGSSPIYGIDISMYQKNEINNMNAQKDTLDFVICKATGGESYVDPKFNQNWTSIKQKGFIRGAYHFYYCRDDPKKQAGHFVKTANFKSTDIPPIVDFEEGGLDRSQSVATIQENLLIFLKEVETKTGRKPMIYTDHNTGNSHLNNPEFATYALWIAEYTKAPKPLMPTAWEGKTWLFWQKADDYVLDGTQDDFDVFNGTKRDLKEFISNY